ncbi:MAG: hypothetical protein NTW13_02005 [Candidatus Omnitrophica bacterium]|nr:hypothetical protein [Candidatus Omnitrophota bacterium]
MFNQLPYDWRRLITIQLKLAKKYLPLGPSIIGLGRGEGILLGECANCGFKVIGVEVGKVASQRAKLRNIEVYNGYFPEINLAGSYQLAILLHVFKHIKHPEAFILN